MHARSQALFFLVFRNIRNPPNHWYFLRSVAGTNGRRSAVQIGGVPQYKLQVYCSVSLSPELRSQQGTALQMGGVLRYKLEVYCQYFLGKSYGLGAPKQCPWGPCPNSWLQQGVFSHSLCRPRKSCPSCLFLERVATCWHKAIPHDSPKFWKDPLKRRAVSSSGFTGGITFEVILKAPVSRVSRELSGPVLRDTARLSQRYPPIARYGVFGVSTWPIGCDNPLPLFWAFPHWTACEV